MNYLVSTKSHPIDPKRLFHSHWLNDSWLDAVAVTPPLTPLPLFIIPKCFSQMLTPLPQLFLKQRQQASGTKELLTKCKVILHSDRRRRRMRLPTWCDGLSCSVRVPRIGNVFSFIWPSPRFRMNFTGQGVWRPECLDLAGGWNMIIFTLCYVRSESSSESREIGPDPSATKHYTQNSQTWLNHEFTFTVMGTVAQDSLCLVDTII